MAAASVTAERSGLGRAYRATYDWLCGRHPRVRPWHFQWVDGVYLYRSLRRELPRLGGRVLDAGCGDTPYREWFGPVTEYVGLDLQPGPRVDVVAKPGEPWPLPGGHFDVLLCSQVLEHVEGLPLVQAEMDRVLRPGGTLVLSFPFLYNEHGVPFDFQRFTAHRAPLLFPSYEVVALERQGGIGSTIGLLLLNWVDQALNANLATRLLKGVLLPVWVPGCLIVNLLGLALDWCDHTGAFYSNVLIMLRKRPLPSSNRRA